ncbi:MAG: hypothetical protein HZB29_03625 [Nitrospinae bacterium]|nr:hypothetical protein [Nitrospinota bacterium]
MNIRQTIRKLPAATLRKAWRLANDLSETKTIDELSQVIFNQTGSIVPHETAALYAQDPLTLAPLPDFFATKNIGDSAENIKRYNERYFSVSPVIKTVGDPRFNNIGFSESDVVNKSSFLDSEYYQDFFKPMGLCQTLVLNAVFHGQTTGTVSFHRPPGARDYTRMEKAALTLVAPAIASAFWAIRLRDNQEARRSQPAIQRNNRYPLTAREDQITRLTLLGHSNREIANELYISEKTAKTHLASIMRKTGAKSRCHLIYKLHFEK